MKNVPIVLLVGLIGSGKSTLLEVLKEKGAAIILTDDLWKQTIYQECHRGHLLRVLGEDVLFPDGTADLKKMRLLFFSPDINEQVICLARLKVLFSEFGDIFFEVLHKEIKAKSSEPQVTMVVVESALALSNGWDSKISPDYVVSLHCSALERLLRIQRRNSAIDKATYLAIMNMQPTDVNHLAMADVTCAIKVCSECSKEKLLALSSELYSQLVLQKQS